MRRPEHTAEQGWLVVAQNSSTVDYADLAYTLALSIRATQSVKLVCLVTDQATLDAMSDKQRAAFYHIALLDNPADNAFENDWQIWGLSPFKETIKVEADCVVPISLDYMWNYLRNRDVAIAVGAMDHRGQRYTGDKYRSFYAANYLPDVYNGLTYWRYTRTSAEFFTLLKTLTLNWPTVVEQYKFMPRELSTDTLYAVAAQIFGEERVTLPDWSWTHMKPAVLDLPETAAWQDTMMASVNQQGVFIGGYRQSNVLHYHTKDAAFITELQEYYERITV